MAFENDLKQNAILGVEIIRKYLQGEINGSDKVKISSLSITQYCKYRSTQGNMDAMKLNIIQKTASTKEEFKSQVRANLPDYVAMEAIPEK